MIAEHTNYAVAQIDGETGKHATHLGIQGHKRFYDEGVWGLLFGFGRSGHGLSERTITRWARLFTALLMDSRLDQLGIYLHVTQVTIPFTEAVRASPSYNFLVMVVTTLYLRKCLVF